jgi:hypothetical protein
VGSAVHAGASYTLEEKRDTGHLGGAAEAENRAEAMLVERLAEGATAAELGEGALDFCRDLVRRGIVIRA